MIKKVYNIIEAIILVALFLILLPGRVNAAPDVNTMWLSNGNIITIGKTAGNQVPNYATINTVAAPARSKDIYFVYCPANTQKLTASFADLTPDSTGKANLLFSISKGGDSANFVDNDQTTGSGNASLVQGSGFYTFTVEYITPQSVFQTYGGSLYCTDVNGVALPLTFSNTIGSFSAQIQDN
jgi:hypothetical protein